MWTLKNPLDEFSFTRIKEKVVERKGTNGTIRKIPTVLKNTPLKSNKYSLNVMHWFRNMIIEIDLVAAVIY